MTRATHGIPASYADSLPFTGKGGHDRRSAAQYARDLAAETERSLCSSPSWGVGQPLEDGERWPWTTTFDLNRSAPGRPRGGPRATGRNRRT